MLRIKHKKDRKARAEDLKRIYQVESQQKAKEALRSLQKRGRPRPKPICHYLYTTNSRNWLAKEMKKATEKLL